MAESKTSAADDTLLKVEDLRIEFRLAGQWRAATRNINFELKADETLALVGESGCGKSITCRSILGLVDGPGARTKGSIKFKEQELVGLPDRKFQKIRGEDIAMIFQEPMTALNPVMRVGDQISEAITSHMQVSGSEAKRRTLELMEAVRIPAPEQRYRDYPHQFSGGMRQRVVIAMALACQPSVLLADEPTTALDVTIQAQVLSELRELRERNQMSVIFITHSMGVVAAVADRVAVMYAGEVVEIAQVETVFKEPRHPYTQALLHSIPSVGSDKEELQVIPGQVPSITNFPEACRFADRCPHVMPRCRQDAPPAFQVGSTEVRCWLYEDNALGEVQ
ncbi:ABC transporter ATP-binding protein [Fodinicurvata sediminis]|uniref:ABC transporter ATP-binding protein n=1 Tax=Fodinicurvata sediminis TaxID=1121832 RepID=UPI0012DCA230|nr:ABC transporter ATP-binding protein [Fodinicurvata sediminis]